MPTCGYLCPACSGTGYVDNEVCNWCNTDFITQESKTCSDDKNSTQCTNRQPTVENNIDELSQEEWLDQVHQGPCCGDWGENRE